MRPLLALVCSAGYMLGCGEPGGTNPELFSEGDPAYACALVDACQRCFDVVFEEIAACMGGAHDSDLVRGTFAADGVSCADDADPMRTVVFVPPAPGGDETMWPRSLQSLTFRRAGSTCGSVSFSESPWQREETAASRGFLIYGSEGPHGVTWQCPTGGEVHTAFVSSKGCDKHFPLTEELSNDSGTVKYGWGGVSWFACGNLP